MVWVPGIVAGLRPSRLVCMALCDRRRRLRCGVSDLHFFPLCEMNLSKSQLPQQNRLEWIDTSIALEFLRVRFRMERRSGHFRSPAQQSRKSVQNRTAGSLYKREQRARSKIPTMWSCHRAASKTFEDLTGWTVRNANLRICQQRRPRDGRCWVAGLSLSERAELVGLRLDANRPKG
jgi:hypothetical protein